MVKLYENKVEFSFLESLLTFKRKIEFGKEKEEEKVKFWYDEYILRLPGTFIPGIIRAGTFYKVSLKFYFVFLLLIFAPLIIASYFTLKTLDPAYLLFYLAYLFVLTLVTKLYCNKKFEKEFWYVTWKHKKIKVIYTRGEYKRIIIGI